MLALAACDAMAVGQPDAAARADALTDGDGAPSSCNVAGDGDGGGFTLTCQPASAAMWTCTCNASWGGVTTTGTCTVAAPSTCEGLDTPAVESMCCGEGRDH